jgi:N-acetylmuramoyl-L-alanine amidase
MRPLVIATVCSIFSTLPVLANPVPQSPGLKVVYPPLNHETTAQQIFFIGTAPPDQPVWLNDQPIERSPAGHFAPSVPLQLGENTFTLRSQTQTLTLKITRQASLTPVPTALSDLKAATETLFPASPVAYLPEEPICFSTLAPAQTTVKVTLADQTVTLQPQTPVQLPANAAVLTGRAQGSESQPGTYSGCGLWTRIGNLGQPQYQITLNGQTQSVTASGSVTILNPAQPEVITVTAESGVTRTGPSTDCSRLTPLPLGTRARVTAQVGEWIRLDYGAWIRRAETQTLPDAPPPRSIIRGITSRVTPQWTELILPLQGSVPLSIQQQDNRITLTLYNTTAQTDTIKLVQNPVIAGVEWQQPNPDQIDYHLQLKQAQAWGYTLRYEGNSLILALRHPPRRLSSSRSRPLEGISIFLDPGHGGPEDLGTVGPTGLPEKDVTLTLTKLLRDRLTQRGATVILSRESDLDLWPNDRAALIAQTQPTIALSLHYNALPDDGDALHTQGVAAFWYHPQAQSLATFLHDYLTSTLKRPSDGVMWNNLALTRPSVAPSVLLELGYMINPIEFEWIRDPQQQQRLADALADGISQWLQQAQAS